MTIHRGRVQITKDVNGCQVVVANLTGEVYREGNSWVSICPPLDLSTCGDSFEEALRNTSEAITLWFQSCLRRGTLEKALQELHWIKEDIQNLSPTILNAGHHRIPTPHVTLEKSEKENKWQGRVEFKDAA
ncbi:MAG: type II toxin-antitoxin system HicB family antitoxin [Myxococcales bacterium]|nr:type II toxin-antitoxin system HicB family antitoxin [Myxococcales bacterium]